MERRELARIGTKESLLKFAAGVKLNGEHTAHKGHAKGALESTREAEHRGHHIVIRTRYEIEVDGRPLTGHVAVDNDGQVVCHALPNYTFMSAVDLVKKLIDEYPEEFPGRKGRKKAK